MRLEDLEVINIKKLKSNLKKELGIYNEGEDLICPQCDGSRFEKEKGMVYKCMTCSNVSSVNITPYFSQLRVIYSTAPTMVLTGAMGTGKTVNLMFMKFYRYATFDSGDSLIGAEGYSILANTSYKELFNLIPNSCISGKPKVPNQKEGEIRLISGHRYVFNTLSDPEKLRSLNLTDAHIEEATNVKENAYSELVGRVRDGAKESGSIKLDEEELAKIALKEKYLQLTLTSNPSSDSWVLDKLIIRAGNVYNYTIARIPNFIGGNKNFEVHVSSAYMNPFLPDQYRENQYAAYENLSRGQVDAYIHGTFTAESGRIFSNIDECCYSGDRDATYDVSLIGQDLGAGGVGDNHALMNTSVYFDNRAKHGSIFVHCEYDNPVRLSISDKVKEYLEWANNQNIKNFYGVFADAIHQGKTADENTLKTHRELFASYGWPMEKAKNATKKYNTLGRCILLREWIESGYLYINKDKCPKLISEMKLLKRDPKSESFKTIGSNHALDALFFIVMELGPPKDFTYEKYISMFRACEGISSVGDVLEKQNAVRVSTFAPVGYNPFS